MTNEKRRYNRDEKEAPKRKKNESADKRAAEKVVN
jgi:hypothetical protein